MRSSPTRFGLVWLRMGSGTTTRMNAFTPNASTPDAPTSDTGAVDLREPATIPTKLSEHTRYIDAQQTVDRLSDAGFPMSNVTIVWSGLRHIEHVTGRRTVATAARDGLFTGAWFGLIIGFLFASFADATTSVVAMVASYMLVGALTVAAFQAFQHWARRGTRDFSTVGQMDAERYEIWVAAPYVDRARHVLGSDLPVTADDV